MKKILAIFFCLSSFVCFAAEQPVDSALTLAQILAEKGTISVTELSRVQTAGQQYRLSVLATILQEKGVLNSSDLARLSPPYTTPAPSAKQTTELAKVEPAASLVSSQPSPTSASEQTQVAVTTKKQLPVSFYGTLLFTTGYNTADFNFGDVPMVATKQGTDPTGSDKNFYASARQTRLGLTLNPLETLGGKLSGAFEFDMMGGGAPYPNGINMNLFRMRLAYGRVDWNNVAIEAGQDWSVFAPLNPTSLNEYGIPEFTSSGNAWIRLPQLRLEMKTRHSGSNLLWQFAASDPNMGDYATTAISVARQPGIGERGRMPSLESRLAWSKGSEERQYTVGLSGHYGRGKNAGAIGTVNVESPVDSWGVALDYSLPVTRIFNLTGEAYEGRALGIYAVANGEAIGAVGTAGAHGVESRGGWIQGQFNFTKQWQMNLAYGLDAPNASQIPVGNRSRNQQYMANIIDKLTRNINASIEYRRILTDFRNQSFGNERGDHIDLGIAFIF